ncbi:hypothetical protein CBR_g31049 [Chara braunii]|uniref:Uncharacterized protein n=1 Tax=Chara braunii TaxID=69332 RepID=A0A388LE55_CHABU|nr:hypothetical protein CBR_g31049 [Chara braunii]|eukprot:GBG80589.1 hypothetical protein CBR_g31049 [Chara braunii]
MTDMQLLHLHYTDLNVLCKMHDIRYKNKPQVILALRQVPGLIAYKGRDFNRDSDLETQIMPDPDNIKVSNTIGGDTSEDDYESLSTRSSGSDEYDSSDTSSSAEDLSGRSTGATRRGNEFIRQGVHIDGSGDDNRLCHCGVVFGEGVCAR